MSEQPIIHTEGLTKHFGSIQAVQDVDFSVREGEVMALVGDNGAGKSTLIKMLCGVLEPSAGQVYIRGDPVSFSSYDDARAYGIETVYQDLALAEKQTVAANVFLGKEPLRDDFLGRLLRIVDENYTIEEAKQSLDRVNIPVDPRARVSNLSGGQQQAVAIARALQSDPDVMIMDEPTSALSIEGARNVLGVIDDLRDEGLSIILISHNIREVIGIADRISVLFQGKLTGVRDEDTFDREEIIGMMMGLGAEEEVEAIEPAQTTEESAA